MTTHPGICVTLPLLLCVVVATVKEAQRIHDDHQASHTAAAAGAVYNVRSARDEEEEDLGN